MAIRLNCCKRALECSPIRSVFSIQESVHHTSLTAQMVGSALKPAAGAPVVHVTK